MNFYVYIIVMYIIYTIYQLFRLRKILHSLPKYLKIYGNIVLPGRYIARNSTKRARRCAVFTTTAPTYYTWKVEVCKKNNNCCFCSPISTVILQKSLLKKYIFPKILIFDDDDTLEKLLESLFLAWKC